MPNYRPTNAGFQTKGTLWAGFDPATTSAVAGVFLVTVVMTFVSIVKFRFPWLFSVSAFLVLPNLGLVLVVFTLVMGKPQRYLFDWVISRLLGNNAVARDAIAERPAPDIEP